MPEDPAKQAFVRRVLAGLLEVYRETGINFAKDFMTAETLDVWYRHSLDIPDEDLKAHVLAACVALKLDPMAAKPVALALRMRRRKEITEANRETVLKVLNNHRLAERNAVKRYRESLRRLKELHGDEQADAKEVFQLQAALAVSEQVGDILDIGADLANAAGEELGDAVSLSDLKDMTVRLRADKAKMPPATYNQIKRESVNAAERFGKWLRSNHPEREKWLARSRERFREYYEWMEEIGLEAEVDQWLREALADYPGPQYDTLFEKSG